jgi:uncharacterized protein YfbU (UPF0304 family)
MELSKVERWLLRNQYRVIGLLDPDASDECGRAIAVLENGYEGRYDEIAQDILDPVPTSECREVENILQMFRELHFSYRALTDDERSAINERDIAFRGFDGNEETVAMAYTRFLIDDRRLWPELASAGDHLNSHIPVLDTYRRMLPVWRACQAERDREQGLAGDGLFTAEQIQRVAAARPYA